MKCTAIVLAAGEGKRMRSRTPKVLHPVCGKPMIGHVVEAVRRTANRVIVVVGRGAEAVQAYLGDAVEYAVQPEPLGTGHAVMQARSLVESGEAEVVLVASGDSPLIRPETLEEMVRLHAEKRAAVTLLTAERDDPGGYGRVVRAADGSVARIVEDKDCSPEEAAVKEINAGVYCFDRRLLFSALARVTNRNAQGEYYLTDVVGILCAEGATAAAFKTSDPAEAFGVNDRLALAEAERLMRRRINRHHLQNGVTMIDPDRVYVDADVEIGPDTVLYPGVSLRGRTRIGAECVIGPDADITDSDIGDRVKIRYSVLAGARVGPDSDVGPFAYVRPGSVIGASVRVGDFVEIKNSTIGDGSKVPHLSYVGDARVGSGVNIGCGAITANYDGYRKHTTIIEDGAFIGSNVNLIAPVRIGRGAYVVAGSTITHDVGEDELAIARERQINKPGYASRLRERIRNRSADSRD
ncbi:MAG: UDP-N-acetylglucosamine diphosphorylase/glucosamine-1-phosphate N-acetyltransferase [Candidatus Reconcilbacillus cellulovorans]|uniref:Bifunctional protein GlmU n=1 Tax=Candidatus Reconcilbacillus cellulovorans TaxID=1906605 RepID=A0A2A6E245_9BACL|nr:MAG: UDP-N-acetylglucosamine diphosphorylase/glucosamine-1-phosphate N-acetyltransferase [Candidatus Reconcilbacillus cellulovorans]